jgi:NTE family protein
MLRALHDRGVVPDLLVGSSAGALNAAFVGGGYRSDRIAALEQIWSRVSAADVFGPPGLSRLVRVLRGGGSLATPAYLRALLEQHLPARHAELAIPCAVVATDLLSGAPVVLEDGDLIENVLASTAIPGVFPPVTIRGRTLADGAIAAHVPVLQAGELGAASVVVLDTGYPCALSKLPLGFVGNIVHLLNLVLRHQAVAALSLLGGQCPVVYLPSPCPLGVAPHDFTQARKLIAGGYRETARFLSNLCVHGPGVYGHPHVHVGGECADEQVRPPTSPSRPSPNAASASPARSRS